MMGEQVEEQGPVPAEQFHQIMALDRFVGPFAEVLKSLLVLEFDGFHLGRQDANQTVFLPFFPGEGRSFIQKWIIEQIIPTFADCHDVSSLSHCTDRLFSSFRMPIVSIETEKVQYFIFSDPNFEL